MRRCIIAIVATASTTAVAATCTTSLASGLPVSWSVVTAAVRPTPDEPRPVVATARGAVCNTYLQVHDYPRNIYCRFLSVS